MKRLGSHPYVANCSLLFAESPLLERPSAAARAGFDEVEFWWPWPSSSPTSDQVDEFATAVEESGVRLIGLNFFAGDLSGEDAGILSHPDRTGEFRASVDTAIGLGRRLGSLAVFNALYGTSLAGLDASRQREHALENLGYAAERAGEIDAQIVLEPLSGPKPYPLRTAAEIVQLVHEARARTGCPNIGALMDLYHLAANGDDVIAAIRQYPDVIGHVQIADSPGRGEPGTGILPIEQYLRELDDAAYCGRIALEYKPSTPRTADSLTWLAHGDPGRL